MWSKIDKAFLIVCIFNIIVFFGFALAVYEVRLENKKLNDQIITNEAEIALLHEQVEVFKVAFTVANIKLSEAKTKISILDESIDPKNKRWALIKRVRAVVEKHARPSMTIKDYTYIAGAIVDYSETHDVSLPLVLAVAKRESAFNPKAKSHAGATGLMQLMSATAADVAGELGKRHYSLYNVKHNVQLGTYFLWKMIDRFNGDVELAVRAYNCGSTCVEKVTAGAWSKYPEETIHYHEAVMRYKKEFEDLGL